MAFTEIPSSLSFTWTSRFPLLQSTLQLRPLHCKHSHHPIVVHPEWTWNYQACSHMWEAVYTARTPELRAGCVYEYTVGVGVVRRHIGRFKARPSFSYDHLPESEKPESLLIVADLGIGPSAQPTIRSIQKEAKSRHYDALLHLGDIAYELDSVQPGVSRAFFEEMEGAASILPYMVLPGNHESYRNFEQYKAQFRMPRNWANEGNSMFYSFNLGPGHFIALSTEEFLLGPAIAYQKQLEWLQKDLSEACSHRDAVPWIVVLAHRPFYCSVDFSFPPNSPTAPHSNQYCGKDALKLRSKLEDLLYRAGVDLVLTGHVHNYQRMQPLYRNVSQARESDGSNWHENPRAPVYIVTGTGGSSKGSDFLSTPQSWVQVQLRETSYSVLQLLNSTHLYWEQVSSISGQPLDYLWVKKP